MAVLNRKQRIDCDEFWYLTSNGHIDLKSSPSRIFVTVEVKMKFITVRYDRTRFTISKISNRREYNVWSVADLEIVISKYAF